MAAGQVGEVQLVERGTVCTESVVVGRRLEALGTVGSTEEGSEEGSGMAVPVVESRLAAAIAAAAAVVVVEEHDG